MLRTMGALTAVGCATGLAACASGGDSAGSPAASTTLPSGSSTSTTASEASSPTGSGATETATASAPEATPTGSGLHGIIVATVPALSLHANFLSVQAIHPGSGSVTVSRRFTPPDDSFELDNWYAVGNGYGLRSIRRLFSRNYDKVAARKSSEGGSGNLDKTVGYIDESGTSHDTTALAPAPGDFEPSTDYVPELVPDDSLHFARRPQNDDDLKTVFYAKNGGASAESAALTPMPTEAAGSRSDISAYTFQVVRQHNEIISRATQPSPRLEHAKTHDPDIQPGWHEDRAPGQGREWRRDVRTIYRRGRRRRSDQDHGSEEIRPADRLAEWV